VQALADQQAAPSHDSDWDVEYHRCLFHWAAERIRPSFQESTWQAFWRTAVEQQEGPGVARSLGLSLGAVHVAKSRVLARLREELQTVDDEEVPLQRTRRS
jgi:RNA polymerase sigma-70 factor (ECF subfamily)